MNNSMFANKENSNQIGENFKNKITTYDVK